MRLGLAGTTTLALLVFAPVALADGIPAYFDDQGWHIGGERAQHAAVSLRGGRESLLLQVDIDAGATAEQVRRLVWITPVPAPAGDVRVAILRGFPRISGVEPGPYLADLCRGALAMMAATQIYPAPVTLFLVTGRSAAGSDAAGFTVHERLRRDGIELELVTAPTVGALRAHLAELSVAFPEPGLEALAPYAGDGAAYVLFRVADVDAYRRARSGDPFGASILGVEIDFPTDEGFYPLVASSALPGDDLDVIVSVLGFATAEDPAPPGLETTHYVGSVDAGDEVRAALGLDGDGERRRYTRFRLRGAPADLTRDLRFRPGAPATTRLAASLYESESTPSRIAVLSLLLFVALSMVSTMLSRSAFGENARPSRAAAAALGLANLATLIGLVVAALVAGRILGAPVRRRLAFAARSSLIFCGFLLLLTALTFAVG